MTMDSSNSGTRETVVPHSVLTAASHELRGPLGVARGYLRLLVLGGQLDPKMLKAVEEASRAGDRMAELLDELSLYARWARGEAQLKRVPVHLADVMAAAAAAVPLPATPAIDVALAIPPDLQVQADEAQLSHAFRQLLASLIRAQVEDARILVRGIVEDGTTTVFILVRRDEDTDWDEEDATLERAGLGLGIAQADLLIRLHGATLRERRHGRTWAGYVVRF
jgi:signal transduction histidine kinase